jgi:uncharacterized protein (UPF0254 family)
MEIFSSDVKEFCSACGSDRVHRSFLGLKCEDCNALDLDEDEPEFTEEQLKAYQEDWDLNDDSQLDI